MDLKFAPLNIPLNRRLQALSAAVWIYWLVFGAFFGWALVIYLFFTSYWPLILLYAAWYYYDRETPFKGGREWALVRNFPLWKYFIDYFPIRLVKTADLPPEKNYLICLFPHGVLSAGVFGNFTNNYSEAKKLFPGLKIRGTTLDMHFNTPLMRDVILGLGATSASKESLLYGLDPKNKGYAFSLIVGGASEVIYARPGPYRIILKKRKGFVKIALQTGCSLVPAFSFGEIDIYDQHYFTPGTALYKCQKFIKDTTGLFLCVPKGRGLLQYSFGIVPQRAPITTVVGKPIDVPMIPNPTEENVQHYHDVFTKALQELFEENKDKYVPDPKNTVLEIE